MVQHCIAIAVVIAAVLVLAGAGGVALAVLRAREHRRYVKHKSYRMERRPWWARR